MHLDDTIVAISSPPSPGGLRAILRLSGPAAHRTARRVVALPEGAAPGHHGPLDLADLPAGNALASVLLFSAPRSFTGDDIAELHLPASPGLLHFLLDRLLQSGVRLAGPGEFSARAFFNGKLDLTAAEGIAATIAATSAAELRAAASLRHGDLHQWTAATSERLAGLLALVEAGIDFAEEEDIRFIDRPGLELALDDLQTRILRQLEASVRIDRLAAPPTVVFVGRPNVGKSSLINALAGQDRSIVSPVAGTTRDMLTVAIPTPAGELRLVDVPGEEPATDELRGKMMQARANALLDADAVVEVVAEDPSFDSSAEPYGVPLLRVRNKADLLPPGAEEQPGTLPLVSAKSGAGIPELRQRLIALATRPAAAGGGEGAGGTGGGERRLVLNHRHRAILQETAVVLGRAAALVAQNAAAHHPELLAAELRQALDLLGTVTGTISPDDVLGRIFSQFCIGK